MCDGSKLKGLSYDVCLFYFTYCFSELSKTIPVLLQLFKEQSEVDVEVAHSLLQQLGVDDAVVNGNHIREERQVGAQEGRINKGSLWEDMTHIPVTLS